MKKFLLFALAVISLVACKSNEQRLAEECLKRNMKCPSTLKVVDFSSYEAEENVTIDTLYLVGYVNERARTVRVDSLKQVVRTYPAHTQCSITFDAQNLMGATVRENASVVILYGSMAEMWDNWWGRCYRLSEDSVWAERSTRKAKSIYTMYSGRWCDKTDFE